MSQGLNVPPATCMRTRTQTHTHAHMHRHTRTHRHTHAHTCTHAHTPPQRGPDGSAPACPAVRAWSQAGRQPSHRRLTWRQGEAIRLSVPGSPGRQGQTGFHPWGFVQRAGYVGCLGHLRGDFSPGLGFFFSQPLGQGWCEAVAQSGCPQLHTPHKGMLCALRFSRASWAGW